MVKRCSYGVCNSDSRYLERNHEDISFVPFPKPKTNLEKCKRWIRLCGRPHHQLNLSILFQHSKAKHRYVCSKVGNCVFILTCSRVQYLVVLYLTWKWKWQSSDDLSIEACRSILTSTYGMETTNYVCLDLVISYYNNLMLINTN